MPNATRDRTSVRSVVFSPIDGTGRAELVAQRLSDAIISGVIPHGDRLPSEAALSTSFNVALVTAREALELLRADGLVSTRRGRGGGSFVILDRAAAKSLLDDRLRERSRIELRDISLHTQAITGFAAELAADRASEYDIESLTEIHRSADLSSTGGARRAVGRFHLEIAAISQSPRLVREEVRLQTETGPLIWLCLREEEYRKRSAQSREETIAAIRERDPARARLAVCEWAQIALRWLMEEKLRVELETVEVKSS